MEEDGQDAAFCFICYLFKHKINADEDAFAKEDLEIGTWERRLLKIVCSMTSFNNMAQERDSS